MRGVAPAGPQGPAGRSSRGSPSVVGWRRPGRRGQQGRSSSRGSPFVERSGAGRAAGASWAAAAVEEVRSSGVAPAGPQGQPGRSSGRGSPSVERSGAGRAAGAGRAQQSRKSVRRGVAPAGLQGPAGPQQRSRKSVNQNYNFLQVLQDFSREKYCVFLFGNLRGCSPGVPRAYLESSALAH
jgi:hypothetical protein